jgi:hypothetical protein
MVNRIKTQILINASKERVWDVLTDIDAWGLWNPFIPGISGGLGPGDPIRLSVKALRGFTIDLSARISRVEPYHYLSWSGPDIPFIFGNEHFFEINPAGPSKTLFIHGEIFSGLVGFFMHAVIKVGFSGLYHAMDTALKRRVETSPHHFV